MRSAGSMNRSDGATAGLYKIPPRFPPRSRLHDVAEPFDSCRTEAVHQDCIEAARRRARKRGEIETCGSDHARAFCRRDAPARATEIAAPAQPHFDEYERVAVARDEIELAAAAAPVALDDLDTVRNEIRRSECLGLRAAARGGQGLPAGTTRPPLNCSARASRVNWRVASRVRCPVAPLSSIRSRCPSASSCATRNASMPSA
jgi:hypothetical protein